MSRCSLFCADWLCSTALDGFNDNPHAFYREGVGRLGWGIEYEITMQPAMQKYNMCEQIPQGKRQDFNGALMKCTVMKFSAAADIGIKWIKYAVSEGGRWCWCSWHYPAGDLCQDNPIRSICTEHTKIGSKLLNGIDVSALDETIKRVWQSALGLL